MDNFGDMLESAMAHCQGSSAFSMERHRPYDGQAYTDCGERGKTLVSGLTMRDIVDCMVMGFLNSTGEPPLNEHPVHDDIYKIDLNSLSPGAIIQNTMCEIEKMMGIFPNLPGKPKQLDLISHIDGKITVPYNPVTKVGDTIEIEYEKYLVLDISYICTKSIMILTIEEVGDADTV